MERHEKWQKVEAGTVIPAGQPYRIEPRDPEMDIRERRTGNSIQWTFQPANDNYEYFFDSLWRPPLELPTEPTWGIVVRRNKHGAIRVQWADGRLSGPYFAGFKVNQILDFIEPTPEQVARIEAAR